jgi:hypothetical protein
MKEPIAMKPNEYDVVQLLRTLPEHGLTAGSRGTVLIDHTKYIDKGTPPAYEVEFMDNAGVTLAVITVPEDNLEVVWRPSDGVDQS